MRFTGKITQVMEVETSKEESTSKWKRQSFVVRDDSPNACFPDEMVLVAWNNHIPEEGVLQVGKHVEVFFSIRTNTVNGKTFNDINVFRVK